MRNLLFIPILFLFFACEETFQLPVGTMISIKPAIGAWDSPMRIVSDSTETDSIVYEHLSALEIVKQTVGLSFQNVPLYGEQAADRGFSEEMRDTVSDPPSLKMLGTDIIYEGNYYPEFIECTDCILFIALDGGLHRDTVGYIPNSVLRAAEVEIKTAFEALDNEEVYRLFNEAFTFVPVTGAEWRALKAKGEN